MISDIVRPKTVAEAVKAKSAPGASYLGGGTWLNSGKAQGVTTLVSLEHLGLESIEVRTGRCIIGASVSFQSLVDSPLVPPVLREAARLTASRTLRNMVTVGGELGLMPDESALIPALLVLGADVSVAGRTKSLPMETYLKDGINSLVLAVSVPLSAAASVQALSRTSHSPRLLVAAVSVRKAVKTLEQPRVVLSDCRGMRLSLPETEQKLGNSPLPQREAIEQLVRSEFSPQSDLYASAAYKRHMAGVMVADLLMSLAGEILQ